MTEVRPLLSPIRGYLARHRRLGAVAERLLLRFPPLQDALLRLVRGDPEHAYARWTAQFDTLGDTDIEAMKDEQARFTDPPLFSVMLPVQAADRASESLRAQVYERWEVETERALRSAAGDFVVLVEPGVVLRPHSLFLFARTIDRNSDAVLIYGDEDVVDDDGVRSAHYFKPDWNEALFRSQTYLGGAVCFRRSSALAVGGFEENESAWGLFLKLTADTPPEKIHHLPFIVSQRSGNAVPRRRRVRPALPDDPPTVSVIVLSTCQPDVLRPCLKSLLETSYPELEVVLVANHVRGDEAHRYLDEVAAHPQVRVLFYEEEFNFSQMNNWAAAQARGELLCFLNDDTEATRSDWLDAMVSHVLQRRVGAVGAKLLYPNGRIQHAGIVLGAGGVATHSYRGSPNGTAGYHDRAVVDQDVSAVSGACMLVRRQAFDAVGAFDAAFAVSYNDIDLCLRLRKAGWRIVWTPGAELYHKEAASLGEHYVGATAKQWESELELMRSRWGPELTADPHYSPNLSLDPLQLWQPAFPPRVSYPWLSGSPR